MERMASHGELRDFMKARWELIGTRWDSDHTDPAPPPIGPVDDENRNLWRETPVYMLSCQHANCDISHLLFRLSNGGEVQIIHMLT